MIKLGDKCKDKVTGFEGIAIVRQQWLTGCDRIGLQPDKIDKGGLTIDIHYFDEPQLKILKSGAVKIEEVAEKKNPGGPRENPIGKSSPQSRK